MILYLMRHADAGVPRENPALDAKRALTKLGKEQCSLMASLLNALDAQFDAILSSPLKRSMQTAQFVGTEMGFEGSVEASPALGPEGSYAQFHALLTQYADHEGVLAVGHNPNLFKFLGRMVSSTGSAAIRMRKGSVAKVDMFRRPPLLQWLIDPRMARSFYASAAKSSRPKTSKK
jgi:phosphohistidine phosphatase